MKTRCVILMMTILLALGFSAYAESLNVFVYPQNAEVESFLKAFIPAVAADSAKLDLVHSRMQSEEDRKLGEELAAAYLTEDEAKISAAIAAFENRAIQFEEINELDIVLQHTELDFEIEPMIKGDPAYLDMVCRKTDSDVIVMPVVSEIQNFKHLGIYVYVHGSETVSLVFEEVSRDSRSFPLRSILPLAQAISSESMSLLFLDGIVDGAEILVDGKPYNILDHYVLVPEGEHLISLSATGYITRNIKLDLAGGVVSSIASRLSPILLSDLTITSDPEAEVFIGGVSMGRTPLKVESYSLPASVRLSSEGYSDSVIGLTNKVPGISVSLKPQWMADKAILKENKDGFYAAFARSLLIFGAKIVTRTLNNGNNRFLTGLDVAASGALTVSLVDMVGCLIDYYRQTEYIAP